MVNILKWSMITALVGAVTGQQIGLVQPAVKDQAETQAAAEIIGDELKACYARNDELLERLTACIEACR